MGTRNLTCVYLNGEFKVAQYGQWDGHPDGQGRTILDFLDNVNYGEFRKKISNLHFITDDEQKELDNFFEEIGSKDGWLDLEQSKKYQEKYYHLSRDRGAEILKLIMEDKVPFLENQIEFAKDSLFCEWCYIIDIDQDILEVYIGSNKKPLKPTDRFYEKDQEPDNQGYYPIKLKATFPLGTINRKEFFELQK